MKWLFAPLLICMSMSFGCTNKTPDYRYLGWPKDSEILYQIKDTSKEGFIDAIKKSDVLTDSEKKRILDFPFGFYPKRRLAKWKWRGKTMITIDQYVIHSPKLDSRGRPFTWRAGSFQVLMESEGKFVVVNGGEYDDEY